MVVRVIDLIPDENSLSLTLLLALSLTQLLSLLTLLLICADDMEDLKNSVRALCWEACKKKEER